MLSLLPAAILVMICHCVTAILPLPQNGPPGPPGLSQPPSPKCPAGQSVFTASTPGAVIGATAGQVWNYIGNFCDPSWQDVTLINTTGTCNQPGNIRYFFVLGATLEERLDVNQGSAAHPDPKQELFGQVFTLVGTYVYAGVTISNVRNLLTVSKSGNNAKINWIVGGCSTDPAASVSDFRAEHGSSVSNAEDHTYT